MELLWNILERFAIHFFSAYGLVMGIWHLLSFVNRRWPDLLPWRQPPPLARLVLAAMIVFAASTLREAYDVANGQPLIKAFTDYASWFLGCGIAAWSEWRAHPGWWK